MDLVSYYSYYTYIINTLMFTRPKNLTLTIVLSDPNDLTLTIVLSDPNVYILSVKTGGGGECGMQEKKYRKSSVLCVEITMM